MGGELRAARGAGVVGRMSGQDGGPAFPESCGGQIIPGMTLRDYFAGQAVQTVLDVVCGWGPVEFDTDINVNEAARFAYKLADAMLAERDKS
jgi:hypothetical protein